MNLNQKKIIITKKIIVWKILDFLIVIGILLYNLIPIITNREITILFSPGHSFTFYFLSIFILFVLILINSIHFIAIYFIAKYLIKKYNFSKNIFNVQTDLTYYREILKDISPATISLLMDLSIENYKDIEAMKLYYELKKVITYDEVGNIIINNSIPLNKSDKILLNYFCNINTDGYNNINEWKENVICENVNNGLIKRKKNDKSIGKGCSFFMIIHILTFILILVSVFNVDKYTQFIENFESTNIDNLTFIHILSENPDYMKDTIFILLFGIVFFVHLANIFASILYWIGSISLKYKDKITRTKEGDFITEKIYGMKNFINDFSNLSEATKKEIVLWEDFLIYAIILEENTKILKEISVYSNKDLLKYKNNK